MEDLNLIQQSNSVVPNYQIDATSLSFEIYCSPHQQICIIGKLDNNYNCWCSMTSITDLEANAATFEYVTKHKWTFLSNAHNALKSTYSEVMGWHRLHVTKRTYQGEDRYYSPVSSCYFTEGKFFAREIQQFYIQEKLKCDYRLIDNSYITILEKYKDLLTKGHQDSTYYIDMKPIIEILEDESYIKLCNLPEVRQLYLDCVNKGQGLYNRYMTDIR